MADDRYAAHVMRREQAQCLPFKSLRRCGAMGALTPYSRYETHRQPNRSAERGFDASIDAPKRAKLMLSRAERYKTHGLRRVAAIDMKHRCAFEPA